MKREVGHATDSLSAKEDKEMGVVLIDSKMPFKFNGPRSYRGVPEGIKFLVGATLTNWAPVLLYCYVTGEMLPFYSILCSQVLGAALGILMYKKQPGEWLSCVPVDLIPDIPSGAQIYDERKAA
jgi:hypothetical protein